MTKRNGGAILPRSGAERAIARIRAVPLTLAALTMLSFGTMPSIVSAAPAMCAGEASWQGDFTPIDAGQWNAARAAHLLERAGFGGTPEQIAELAAIGPEAAVDRLTDYERVDNSQLKPFEPSDIHDPGLDPFPVSRPAATELAKKTGESMGVKVKPNGPRRLQPVADKFFYWLRASKLETDRIAYWWADRMVRTNRPLEEKLALFWHGHFATNDDKVRDARKMLRQLEWFQRAGGGEFRPLLLGVARDPAMLAFLDAGVNVKGAPNENFAREIMELFSLGVGNYSEKDIREAARAFTGWYFKGLEFVVNPDKHDDGEKTVLGRTGKLDGVDVIDTILAQPVSSEYIATKLYRFFVRDEVDAAQKKQLGAMLRDDHWTVRTYLRRLFIARDFYAPASCGTHIKGPVELVVSTYRKLGVNGMPGIPDFNQTTGALGQYLLQPPTVAGWSQGRSWITPGLLIERGNFVRDVLFPDVTFHDYDRYSPDPKIRAVHQKIAQGFDIPSATMEGRDMSGDDMAMSNKMADADEDFNTRFASYRGWQMAIERVKPIPRNPARVNLVAMVKAGGMKTPDEVVDRFLDRFMSVPVGSKTRTVLIDQLRRDAGTDDIQGALSYLEEPLRRLVHVMLSLPEYQLG